MKFRYILLIFLLSAIAGGAYYYYQQTLKPTQTEVWSFVPTNAILVYETNGLPSVKNKIEEAPAGKIATALPLYAKLQTYWAALDSASSGQLNEFLEDRPLHVSLHITGKNSFDYLFYFPVQGVADYNTLREVLESFTRNQSYVKSERIYQNTDIFEFTEVGNKNRFSYILEHNYLIGSFTPFLIEDVIRQQNSKDESTGFKKQHLPLFQLSHIDTDEGNLYLNGERLPEFMNLFRKESINGSSFFSYGAKLDIALNQDGVLLNGYAVPEEGDSAPYLSSLLHEEPQTLGLAHLVPIKTSFLHFFGFADGKGWHEKLRNTGVLKEWDNLLRQYPDAGRLPALIGRRIALAQLQSPGEEEPHKLVYLHLKEPQQASEYLQSLAESMNRQSSDTLYQEEYSGYKITQLSYPQLPEALLGPRFSGFRETFFLQYSDYLILSNSIQALKSLLVNIEGDNTWRKTLSVYQFLEKTNQETNYGYYMNTERAWKELVEGSEPDWRQWMEEFGPYLRQYNMLAVQLSALDDLFYTNVLLQAVPQDVQDLRKIRLTQQRQLSVDTTIRSKPMLMKSSPGKSREIVVQTIDNRLFVGNMAGDIRQVDSLQAPLIDELYQLEPAKDGKVEYLGFSRNSLYRYNADFGLMPGFPVAVPDSARAQWANVIDYNGSKMYRLLVAAETGDIYMFDLAGNALEGWNPNLLNGALSASPGHIRVRGKDCLYAFQQKGVIQVMNRRGKNYDGFPLNLKDSLLGPVHIKAGSDFKTSIFTTITKGGELISFNLLGRITKQEQLFKPDGDTRFRIVPDKLNNDFLILRESRNRISLLDRQGNLLFEKDYLVASGIDVQYYNFGTDKEVVAVTDPQEEFTYLYDQKGNLMNFEPLNSCCPISILYQEKEGNYQIIKSYQNTVDILRGVR